MFIRNACVVVLWCCVLFSTAARSFGLIFSNPNSITISSFSPAPTTATPYPSTINVAGYPSGTTIQSVTVTINNFSHIFPDDVDMMLVGPTGAKIVFWSDALGGAPVNNLNITLSDSAASRLPDNSSVGSGTYQSAAWNAMDTFPAPAPAPVAPGDFAGTNGTATFTSAFNGTDPNGIWSLYVVDDIASDSGSVAGGWTLGITVKYPPPQAGQLLISEFRLHGPNGASDEFIELYNNTDAPLTVQAADVSGGLGIAASDGVLLTLVSNGTVIPGRGHYLCANVGFSLTNYSGTGAASGDVKYATDIANNTGIALFNSATSFAPSNRLDAVGPDTETNAIYRKGAGYSAIPTVMDNFSFVRKVDWATGVPQETGDNANDFRVIAVNANATIPSGVFGAPGPENLASPISRDGGLAVSLMSPCASATNAPNRIRTGSGNSGTLSIRRRITNITGTNITRLRFRIVDITTTPSPNTNSSILAATSSTSSFEMDPCFAFPMNIYGLTLETPPAQPVGGGYNASLLAGTITLLSPLVNGESIIVNFLLNISREGLSRFVVQAEALPFGSVTFITDAMDFGDAPDSYSTRFGNNGPRHWGKFDFPHGSIYLGNSKDVEIDGAPSALANGDNLKDGNDEGGVTFGALKVGSSASVSVVASTNGLLDVFMDFNADGDFADAGEKIFDSVAVSAGTNSMGFSIPINAVSTTNSFARFRISTAGGLSYNGAADDGEVEDYQITILANPPNIVSAGFSQLTDPCAVTNNVIDPRETVLASFTLQNIGGPTSSNVIATLMSTGGITFPSGPQNYGVMGSSSTATRPFLFTASGTCGGSIYAVLMIQDGSNILGFVTNAIQLGTPIMLMTQTFDAVSLPTLPVGWTTSGTDPAWITTDISHTPPNAAFGSSTDASVDRSLISPTVTALNTNGMLIFYHRHDFGPNVTRGGVLEVSVDGGAFIDVLAAGCTFSSGGYNGTIAGGSNPLNGRSGWVQVQSSFIDVIMNLPASMNGHQTQWRWRIGTATGGGLGWYVDSVSLQRFQCCDGPFAPVLVNVTRGSNSMDASFASVSGQNYVLEYKDSLSISNWSPLHNVSGDDSLKTVTITNTSTPRERYFRLRSP